jgi:trigger factor
MKYTIERLPESRVAIDVEVEPEIVEQALGRAARRIAQRARIPGFRPGKAPRYIVEMHFGRNVLYEDAGEELIQQALKEIMDKGEIEPVAQADVEKFEKEPFSFRLVIPVRPTVTLGDYRTLRFPEEVLEVTDEDVEHALKHMQDEQTVWKEPDPFRPARAGDRVVVDLLGHVGEKVIEERKDVEVVVGDENLLPGFEALVGAESGQTLQINTTVPEDLEDKELAGQSAIYTVAIHGIKEPEAPPVDDEFARSFGEGEQTLDELRARLRRDLGDYARKQAREKVLVQMLDAVVEGAAVDMPQVMVANETDALFEEQAQQMRTYNLSMAQYFQFTGQSEEEYRQELAKVAPGRMRRYLVLRELIRVEGIAEGTEMQEQLQERLLAIARGELALLVEELAAPAAEETPAPAKKPRRAKKQPAAAGEAASAAEEPAAPVAEETPLPAKKPRRAKKQDAPAAEEPDPAGTSS